MNKIVELLTPEEFSGILNLLIFKARKIVKYQRLTYNQTANQLRIEWKQRADPVELFARNYLKKEEGKVTPKDEVRSQYIQYCIRTKIQPKSNIEFTNRMKNLGYEDGNQRVRNYTLDPKGKSTRFWKSVTLVTPLQSPILDKQNENKKPISIADKDICNNVTDVTENQKKLYYQCFTCVNGGSQLFKIDGVTVNGLRLKHHTQKDHKIKYLTQKEADKVLEEENNPKKNLFGDWSKRK